MDAKHFVATLPQWDGVQRLAELTANGCNFLIL